MPGISSSSSVLTNGCRLILNYFSGSPNILFTCCFKI
ncbi:hypothetical protein DXA54_13605 [Bacteroides sp. OF03-11BH]|nr:hypothetical protein DXA54_13605 [Bacteroides sp. OF03-11BH]